MFVLLYQGLSISTSFGWSGGGGEVGRRERNYLVVFNRMYKLKIVNSKINAHSEHFCICEIG